VDRQAVVGAKSARAISAVDGRCPCTHCLRKSNSVVNRLPRQFGSMRRDEDMFEHFEFDAPLFRLVLI
jgi:hypothetical protein